MKKKRNLLAKWCVFWHALDDSERLFVMRMIGYRGGYPAAGVSPVLMARLLYLTLKSCHNQTEEK